MLTSPTIRLARAHRLHDEAEPLLLSLKANLATLAATPYDPVLLKGLAKTIADIEAALL